MTFFKVVATVWIIISSWSLHLLMAYESKIDAVVIQALEKFHIPGAAIAVVADNKLILCQGYGMRDLENQFSVTENTIFPIASNTKGFTSLLIAQLAEEGKLAWDDPVIQYLPEFRLHNHELSSKVTLRDLIAHRTGVPRHDALWYLVRDLSEEDVLKSLPHLAPIAGLRETFLYNNFMYVVAAKVIEKVTNNTWEEEIASRILKPLGMGLSGTSSQFQEMSNIAQPYAEMGGKIQRLPFLYPISTLAASAIYSSVSDMVKWVQIQLFDEARPNFIKQDVLNEMHTIQILFASQSSLEPAGYGLGWEIDSYKGRKQVHHAGSIEGFFSEVSLLPHEKIGVVILTNSSTDGRYASVSIKNAIYDYLLGLEETDWIQKSLEERLKANQNKNLLPLQKYEGEYVHPAYGTMQITLQYDVLVATLGKMRVELNPKREEVFEAKYPALLTYGVSPLVEFSFFSNSSGKVEEVHVPFEYFRAHPSVIFKKV